MWHASVSVGAKRPPMPLLRPETSERLAVEALTGVGDPTVEWWFYNSAARVGHLRVPVTPDEVRLVPPGIVTMDAGESGPLRPRTIRG